MTIEARRGPPGMQVASAGRLAHLRASRRWASQVARSRLDNEDLGYLARTP